MNTTAKRIKKHYRKGFAAVLGLLVVVAILLILYFLQAGAIFQPGGASIMGKSDPKEKRPWLDEDRILSSDQPVLMPHPPKPTLDEEIRFTSPVTLNGENRGRIELTFNTLGEVAGSWQTQYEHPGEKFGYAAQFSGNIDIEKTYEDKNGKDKSRLFFITKGKYTKITTDTKTNASTTEQGIAYVTGYMKPDHATSGLITLTTDQSWAAHYTFSYSP